MNVGCRGVQRPHVVNRNTTGFDLNRNCAILPELRLSDGADEATTLVVVINWTSMRTRDHHQCPILDGRVVNRHANGDVVVVGMGMEGPVLMPFDRTAECSRLHVQFVGALLHNSSHLAEFGLVRDCY